MKIDLSYSFDKNLQEVANNSNDINIHIENLLEKVKSSVDQINLLSEIGVYYRIIRELDKSLHYLNLAKSKGADSPSFKIRLAHTYQWMKNFEMSNHIFNELILNIDDCTDSIKAFIHQHRGKIFFDQGLYPMALAEFEIALEIRVGMNAPLEQIQSSRDSILRTKELL